MNSKFKIQNQPHRKQAAKFKIGFTLIELFIIIGIIGILALISIPAFRAYQPSLQLSGAIRNLASDLRYAQQLSVTEQVEHSVYFVLPERKYQIRRYGTLASTIKETVFSEEIIEITISGLSDVEGNKEARYNPYGAVKTPGSVALKNSKNITTTVDIKPSGFVKITK